MKHSVDPCEDFYSFACGSFAEGRVVPEHAKKVTVLYEMKRSLDRHLRDILESPSLKNGTAAIQLARTYYLSCMDEDSQSELGSLPLLSLISQMGGWELLTNARFDSADYHWEAMAGQVASIGVDGLIKVFVHNSFEDRDTNILMFCPPKLFLEKKKFYRGAPSTNAFLAYYRQYIMDLLKLLGVDVEDDMNMIDYQVNDIIDLERRIANLSRSDTLRNHSVISNLMTYGAFRERYPEIRWELFFNEELRASLGPLTDDMLVNVVDLGYFDGLSTLVRSKPLSAILVSWDLAKRSPKTLLWQFSHQRSSCLFSSVNNYMMWRLVSTFDMYLPPQFRRPSQEFQASMFGATAEVGTFSNNGQRTEHDKYLILKEPHWENCVREVAENLAMPLSTAYASTYFSPEDRRNAEEMIEDLKKSMERLLLDAEWMDGMTRTAALKKLENMGHKIG
ncbi:unnamed protein product [Heligmosomoides polygyrus]|uniref:Peptidase_M13_N domain-containing protein n=1 Tax=Heligmosomoides polygyrus TaxID=6339 RepID=A0A3P8C484_HELPZ|nr:unnamed protein product [Heligmosomoides polygyrus]